MNTLSEKLFEVASKIKQSANKEHNHPDFVYLRNLEDFCNNRLFQTNDKTEQLVCFIITRFIDSFFSNLAGDTPYDVEVHNSRVNFNNVLAEIFFAMSKSIIANDRKTLFDSASALINEYVALINYLNKNY